MASLKSIAVVLLIAGCFFGAKMWSRHSVSEETLERTKVVIAEGVSDEAMRARFVELAEAAHEKSFSAAYLSGGKRSLKGELNEDLYFETLFWEMSQIITDSSEHADLAEVRKRAGF